MVCRAETLRSLNGLFRRRRAKVLAAWLATVPGLAAAELRAQVPTPKTLSGTRTDSGFTQVTVHVSTAGRPIEAAIVRSSGGRENVGTQTDERGTAILRLVSGERRIVVSKLGYASDSLTVRVRAGADTAVAIELREAAEPNEHGESHEKGEGAAELSRVVVTATRGQRRVDAEPTRVEVLDHEEVEEQTAMTPGNVAGFLGETGGVRVTSTAPGLGGVNLRVQGLRGRYVQLLSDGLPLYGLTTEGLGLLQIPPIDLRQVELIKGAASALYGPSALGGVVNFASRRPPVIAEGRPRETRELYLNQTSLDGSDVALFDGRALSPRWGYTLLATGSRQSRRDVDDDGWTDVAGYRRGVVRPRLFWTGADGSDVFSTVGFTAEDRSGGTTPRGRVPAGTSFVESRGTSRGDAGVVAHVVLDNGRALALRGSATSEWRRLAFGTSRERDRRTTLFSEAALTVPFGRPTATGSSQEAVVGVALQRDEYAPTEMPLLGYAFVAPALFGQHTWTPNEWFGITSSLRIDRHSEYGTTVSPRVSAVVRPRTGWTARISGGAGSYAPTPFVEELEEVGLTHLRPIRGLRAESARNVSADVGTLMRSVELNAAVYASVIRHPVGLRSVEASASGDSVELVNATLPTRTNGAQLFARYRSGAYGLTASYDYQRATEEDIESRAPGLRREIPLTPRHGAGLMGSWETADDAGVSIEAFYTGRQSLSNNPYRRESESFVMLGALVRFRVGKTILFANAENLGNVRQTRYDPLLLPAPGLAGRWTTDAWAPLDGRVVNAGARIGF